MLRLELVFMILFFVCKEQIRRAATRVEKWKVTSLSLLNWPRRGALRSLVTRQQSKSVREIITFRIPFFLGPETSCSLEGRRPIERFGPTNVQGREAGPPGRR